MLHLIEYKWAQKPGQVVPWMFADRSKELTLPIFLISCINGESDFYKDTTLLLPRPVDTVSSQLSAFPFPLGFILMGWENS